MTIRTILAALCALLGLTATSHAQSWPSKPVRVIVPITAGSAIDIVARATAAASRQGIRPAVRGREPARRRHHHRHRGRSRRAARRLHCPVRLDRAHHHADHGRQHPLRRGARPRRDRAGHQHAAGDGDAPRQVQDAGRTGDGREGRPDHGELRHQRLRLGLALHHRAVPPRRRRLPRAARDVPRHARGDHRDHRRPHHVLLHANDDRAIAGDREASSMRSPPPAASVRSRCPTCRPPSSPAIPTPTSTSGSGCSRRPRPRRRSSSGCTAKPARFRNRPSSACRWPRSAANRSSR